MGIEVRPLGVKCNLRCEYCYQNPERDAGNLLHSYDLGRIKAEIEKTGGPFSLFGGEALMTRERDLEALWSWGFQKYGRNGLQTNATLITDDHLRMFKAYRVDVGISLDGPGELNDARWAGSLASTRAATARTEAAIERLCAEGIRPGLIITLHRGNATADKLPRMYAWVRRLDGLGITSVRLHILEVEDEFIRRKYALTVAENLQAFRGFLALEGELSQLRFDVFDDMRKLLRGQDRQVSCVWTGCDPYTTAAVSGIEGNGQRTNCGRTNKDGIEFTKASTTGFERYLALYQTPQEFGGCRGCRFFLMCKGQCPGTAIDGDWRNRTEHCEVWKQLYGQLERELAEADIATVASHPARGQIEREFLAGWSIGQHSTIAAILERLEDTAASPSRPAEPTLRTP
jgi:uncharacterized protein